MYATCQEFLDLGGGDYEEHAILLANYFMFIDKEQAPGKFQTFLVYGYAVPEGKNVFVLRKFANPDHKDNREHGKDFEIWSPMTGECFVFKEKKQPNTFCGLGRT